MLRRLICLVAVIACGRGSPERPRMHDDSLRRNLVGAWDARMSLLKPYPLGASPGARQICGTLGFVENHHAEDQSSDDDRGVYDLDLSQLGLGWVDVPAYPIALATLSPNKAESSRDSVAIVLNPGSGERILLIGRYDVDGINGNWTAQSARGTAMGVFLLSPHIKGGERLRKC